MPQHLPLEPLLVPLRLSVLTSSRRVVYQAERLQPFAEPVERPVDVQPKLVLHLEPDGGVLLQHPLCFPRAKLGHGLGRRHSDMVGEDGLSGVAPG
jgi:hypothetical protein